MLPKRSTGPLSQERALLPRAIGSFTDTANLPSMLGGRKLGMGFGGPGSMCWCVHMSIIHVQETRSTRFSGCSVKTRIQEAVRLDAV